MLLLTSVPHSGTHFFSQLIGPDRVKHVGAPDIPDLLPRATTIACAIRQPESVWKSWWNRRENLNEARDGPNDVWAWTWEQLDLIGRTYPHKIWYLPIDHETRIKRLRRLGKHLGVEYFPDWDRQVNSGLRYRGPEPRIDFAPIYKIPIIGELYG